MRLKQIITLTFAALVLPTACLAQGSVFSLDGGSQVISVSPRDGTTSFDFTNSAFLNNAGPPLAPNGSICVNLYVYDPTPSAVLCCSCQVKAFQTVQLDLDRELLRLRTRPVGLTAFVLANSLGMNATCPGPSTVAQSSVIPFGLAASKTTNHL